MIGTSGIGLGLNMSYDLIEALEGTMNIESQEGEGTEVCFKIKVQTELQQREHFSDH